MLRMRMGGLRGTKTKKMRSRGWRTMREGGIDGKESWQQTALHMLTPQALGENGRSESRERQLEGREEGQTGNELTEERKKG